mmetsp:Transcript_116351/g.183058  ORF Transcript_116351/g.183058 Transcript_116351/m.183058 type:complete len:586 (-) Transcript_116351:22-1779(-)
MSDNATSKPRVLLSIMKGEGFEMFGDSADLCTAIIAGFGRFECERVLKPSGVELMNLSHSANIEISVLKRERETGQKHLLLRGIVPLSMLHASFFTGDGASEPQSWENWLGLFAADVSLKGQAPERVFQQCLEMGSAPNKGSPRLFIRLQYLQPGASAVTKAPPTGMNPNMEMSMRGQLSMNQPSQSGMPALKAFPSGMVRGGNQQADRLPPTTGMISMDGGANQQVDRLPPTSGITSREGAAVGPSWLSRGVTAIKAPTPPKAHETHGTSNANRTASPQQSSNLLGRASTRGVSVTGGSPIQFQRPRVDSKTRETGDGGTNWREKCEEMERSKAGSQEKISVLEKALRDVTEKNQALQQELSSQRHLQTVEVAELRQMVAELRLQKDEIEQENLRLYEQEGAREDAARSFFEQVAPSLSGLGRPSRVQPAEAVASLESMQSQFALVAKTLADALVERSSSTVTQSAFPEEDMNLFGESLERALEGSEEFDAWLSRKIDAPSRTRLGKAGRLLSACGQVAQLRDASRRTAAASEASDLPIAVGPFYVPVKTDPVDLYIASSLLRLASDPTTASVATAAATGLLRL